MAKSVYTHIVLRPFQAEGRDLEIGAPVDASGWRNTARLVETKYMRLVTHADLAQLKATTKSTGTKTVPSRKKFTVKKKR